MQANGAHSVTFCDSSRARAHTHYYIMYKGKKKAAPSPEDAALRISKISLSFYLTMNFFPSRM